MKVSLRAFQTLGWVKFTVFSELSDEGTSLLFRNAEVFSVFLFITLALEILAEMNKSKTGLLRIFLCMGRSGKDSKELCGSQGQPQHIVERENTQYLVFGSDKGLSPLRYF